MGVPNVTYTDEGIVLESYVPLLLISMGFVAGLVIGPRDYDQNMRLHWLLSDCFTRKISNCFQRLEVWSSYPGKFCKKFFSSENGRF